MFGQPMQDLDPIAESYVRLTLALGEIDPYHVDAYFGPAEWKDGAQAKGLDQIVSEGEAVRADLNPEHDARSKFLAKQMDALLARARLHRGEKFSFDEESAAVYDVVAPSYPDDHYAAIIREIEPMLPGTGSLSERWEEFRKDFYIPAERLDAVFQAGVDLARERTRKHIALPEDERFSVELVSGQVWGAYNWYKGGSHSLIQVNTDLPMAINRVIHLACHEGYPGHHVYNALLERHMVKQNGWVEFTVYPLYSPESLIAEGTAEYGVELGFSQEDRLQAEREVLYPLAGLDPSRAEEITRLQGLMDGLGNATNEAARRYLDGKATREETLEWLHTYALASPKRAQQNIRFFEAHRSYIVTYNVGEEMVKRHVTARGKDAGERWAIFTEILSRPTVPSDLLAGH